MTHCPRDGCTLGETRIVRVMAEVCPYCDGTWLAAGKLAQLRRKPVDLPPSEGLEVPGGRETIRCPQCKVEMTTRWFSDRRGVLVDVCSQCEGLWLDTAELKGIIEEGRISG